MDRPRGVTVAGEGHPRKALSPVEVVTPQSWRWDRGTMWAFLVTATETAVQLQKLMRSFVMEIINIPTPEIQGLVWRRLILYLALAFEKL